MGFGKEESSGSNMLIYFALFVILALGGMYFMSGQAKPQSYYLNQEPQRNTVSVSGESKMKVAPDLAQISFTIETNDSKSAKISQNDNAQLTEKVKTALLAAGVSDKDITTTQYTVEPIKRGRWECPDPLVKCESFERLYYEDVIGYRTVHTIFVKSDDTSKTGGILDAIGDAGGSNAKINSVGFSLKDETKKQLEKDLLEKASAAAKEKAQKIASGAGVSLGKPLMLSESINYPIYYNYNYAEDAMKAAGAPAPQTQVFGGEVDVTASVSATFEVN